MTMRTPNSLLEHHYKTILCADRILIFFHFLGFYMLILSHQWRSSPGERVKNPIVNIFTGEKCGKSH
jgi:hypothetical protein